MRFVMKMFAAPAMGLLTLTVSVCSFVLVVAGFVCRFLTVVACIGGIVLLFVHQPVGGIAFLVIAFLVSPYGLPAVFARLVGKMNGLRYSLKEFILG